MNLKIFLGTYGKMKNIIVFILKDRRTKAKENSVCVTKTKNILLAILKQSCLMGINKMVGSVEDINE